MITPYHLFNLYLGKRVHVGVCGSIAAYRMPDVLRSLNKVGAETGVTLTRAGSRFIPALNFRALGADPVYVSGEIDDEETFAHLAPGKIAHSMLIAPATANTLARIAGGFADDLLSCQVLAFSGPIALAPAMNPTMWNAPAVQENWEKLKKRGFVCIEPDSGGTACGDTGQGRLAEDYLIFLEVLKTLTEQDMSGQKVLITCGPTRESFDPVRFWSNPSSGKMGLALALAAWLRGAQVHVIHGPIAETWLPPDIKRVPVQSASEMHQAVTDKWQETDIGCFAAAVADFTPDSPSQYKTKKSDHSALSVHFSRTPDILARAGKDKKDGQKLIGFAAETENLETACAQKLRQKNLDMIVGNLVSGPGNAFASDQNTVLVQDREGRKETWPPLDKTEVAWRIWDWLRDIE
jgi:phosphopantothenoylcysteine decarboxylase/phosphopantothenate--cysteine ligase